MQDITLQFALLRASSQGLARRLVVDDALPHIPLVSLATDCFGIAQKGLGLIGMAHRLKHRLELLLEQARFTSQVLA